jgi:hypothetical protein
MKLQLLQKLISEIATVFVLREQKFNSEYWGRRADRNTMFATMEGMTNVAGLRPGTRNLQTLGG